MRAIFEDRGKQYTVQEGDVIAIDLVEGDDKSIEFDKVLLLSEKDDVKIGTPYLAGAKVKVSVVKDTRDDKVLVFKFKNTRNYIRTKGHKQPYTMIKVESITA
ncbi:MAG: 50S ribosomal protein L21 [Spirochaetales bacterium]|jgi:large subunit ribosomal protein L21|nr:50S ribosomal protein L21 [Spirochaetales bacterium]MBR6200079.1 50S ribosomal protein L21 [Spirochaetales bacterium]